MVSPFRPLGVSPTHPQSSQRNSPSVGSDGWWRGEVGKMGEVESGEGGEWRMSVMWCAMMVGSNVCVVQ